MAIEVFSNTTPTTLSSSINNAVTTLTVASVAGMPATGNFRILIGSEIMLVTGVAGTVLTVTRGVEGTTAASHTAADAVVHLITSAALLRVLADNIPTGGYATRPTAGREGRLYISNDAPVLWYDNGTVWLPVATNGGTLIALPNAPITIGSFTWVNQGGATATGKNGLVDFVCPANTSDSLRMLVKTVPTAPYKAEITLNPNFVLCGSAYFAGLVLREAGTGKCKVFSCLGTTVNSLSADYYTNSTTFSATIGRFTATNTWPTYMRIFDDNTNLKFQASADGVTWFTVATQGRTVNFTADQVGIFMNNTNTGEDIRCWFNTYREY